HLEPVEVRPAAGPVRIPVSGAVALDLETVAPVVETRPRKREPRVPREGLSLTKSLRRHDEGVARRGAAIARDPSLHEVIPGEVTLPPRSHGERVPWIPPRSLELEAVEERRPLVP